MAISHSRMPMAKEIATLTLLMTELIGLSVKSYGIRDCHVASLLAKTGGVVVSQVTRVAGPALAKTGGVVVSQVTRAAGLGLALTGGRAAERLPWR